MSHDNQGKSADQLRFSTVVTYTCFGLLYVLMIGAYIHACAAVSR